MTSDGHTPIAFRRLLRRWVLLPPLFFGGLALVFLCQVLYLMSAARWVDHTDKVIADANLLLRMLVDRETRMRGYLITGDPIFLDHAENAESIHPVFDGLNDLVSDNPPQVERLKVLQVGHADWQIFAQKIIALRREGKDLMPLARTLEGKTRMDAMRVQVADFIRIEEELRDTRTRTVRQATWAVITVSLGLALFLGGGMAIWSYRRLMDLSASYRVALAAVEAQAESLRKTGHRLETLHQIDRAILSAESIPELTREALQRMERVIPGGDAFVAMFNADRKELQVIPRNDLGKPWEVSDRAMTLAIDSPDGVGLQIIPDLAKITERTEVQAHLFHTCHRTCVTVPLQSRGKQFGMMILANPEPSFFSEEHQQIAFEVAQQLAIAIQQSQLREQQQRHAEELERRVEERTRDLQQALDNVKQLQGLLPKCAWCKKVRDDKDYWHDVEHYVAAHTKARFSHGICPDCYQIQAQNL